MASSTSESYLPVKWRLIKSPYSFRLIYLEAGKGDDPLSCVLKEATFDDSDGRFIAISYNWGTTDLNRTILCSGYTVRITENLHSALRRLRLPTQFLRIWCDALCINQGQDPDSLLERSQQIPLMNRIFSSAVRVVIDLGDEDGTLTQAAEGINAILATPQDRRARCHLEPSPLEFLNLPQFTHPMWSALRTLMSRAWFQRIWCVQEFILARDARVLFGPHVMTVEQLVSVASVYLIVSEISARKHQTTTWDVFEWSQSTMGTMCLLASWRKRKARTAGIDNHSTTLCDLLISTMAQDSTDRRDRVYALYGMLDSRIVMDLPVSYSESVTQLSRRLSDYLLRSGNGVWMLVHSGGIGADRPSWTLDLERLHGRERLEPLALNTRADGQNALYAAGGGAVPDVQAAPSDGCIRLKGVIAGEIISSTTPYPFSIATLIGSERKTKITHAYLKSYVAWIKSVLDWAEQVPCSDPEALWRTLVANHNPHPDDHERSPSGHPLSGFGAYFEELLTWLNTLNRTDLPVTLEQEHPSQGEQEQYHIPANAVKFWVSMIAPLLNRRVARTSSGALALVPTESHAHDAIAVFHGFPLPFVLRRDGDGYFVVGICYVHGLMNGEAFQLGMPEDDILLR